MRSSRGETLAESLAAFLITVLSSVLFLTCTLTGTRIGSSSTDQRIRLCDSISEVRSFISGKNDANGTCILYTESEDGIRDEITVETFFAETGGFCGYRYKG
ncbi:MAG: hypothetical protein IJS22_07830 [Lachnospiraceae bacterium]|nr:hypothetical protein [Lachnospiraceae bacterium]